jgi:halocyanin-like protein
MSESSPTGGDPSAPVDGSEDRTALGRREFVRASVGAAAAVAGAGAAGTAAAQAYDGWLSDVDNYEATIDNTGRKSVTVDVGAGENSVLFDPPAILVDPGTTVVWEWTGDGGTHNVVHDAGDDEGEAAFESELTDEPGATFEYTFEDEAAFRYFCSPHRTIGMKGVVAVGGTDDEVVDPAAGGDGGGGGIRSTTDLAVLAGAAGLGVSLVLAVLSAADRPGGGA